MSKKLERLEEPEIREDQSKTRMAACTNSQQLWPPAHNQASEYSSKEREGPWELSALAGDLRVCPGFWAERVSLLQGGGSRKGNHALEDGSAHRVPGQHKLAPKVYWDGSREDTKQGESREVGQIRED